MSHNPPKSPPAARPQPIRSLPAARLPPAQPDHASTPRSVRRRLLAHTKLMSGGNVVRVVLILLFWLLFAHWFAPAAPHTIQRPNPNPKPVPNPDKVCMRLLRAGLDHVRRALLVLVP